MNWILIVWVVTGMVQHIEQIEFSTYTQCEQAEIWVKQSSYTHKAKCFRKR